MSVNLFIFLLFSSKLLLPSKKQGIERILTYPYSYMWQKFSQMNEKVTWGISVWALDMSLVKLSLILQLFLRRFSCLIFALSRRS